jgi:nucleoid-associated protein EbfC
MMKNLGNMMKQAQQMQARMEEMQAGLAQIEVSGQSGAGMVSVTLSGKGDVRSVKIDPKVIDPADVEMLEDLLVAAFNDARGKVDATVQEQTQKLMGGLGLPPGFKLPF